MYETDRLHGGVASNSWVVGLFQPRSITRSTTGGLVCKRCPLAARCKTHWDISSRARADPTDEQGHWPPVVLSTNCSSSRQVYDHPDPPGQFWTSAWSGQQQAFTEFGLYQRAHRPAEDRLCIDNPLTEVVYTTAFKPRAAYTIPTDS